MASPAPDTATFFVQAEYAFASPDGSALSFACGEVIEVLTQLDSGWWDGLLADGERGWFPSNYVRRISDEAAERWFLAREAGELQPGGTEETADADEVERTLRFGTPSETDPTLSLFYHPESARPYSPDPDAGSPDAASDVRDFWIPSMTADGQVRRIPLL